MAYFTETFLNCELPPACDLHQNSSNIPKAPQTPIIAVTPLPNPPSNSPAIASAAKTNAPLTEATRILLIIP